MCLFGSDVESPREHTEPPVEVYEQQETMSGIDMMIRHFKSQSFREYQSRHPESRTPSPHSRIPSPHSRTPSPHSSVRPLTRISPTIASYIIDIPGPIHVSVTEDQQIIIQEYKPQQKKIFANLIADT